jgi:hypothetical protein
MRDLPVRITGNGIRHKVEVDGHDVSNMVTRAELEIDPREGSVLRLQMIVGQVMGDERAVVLLDGETTEALKAMGWTPPAGGAS